MNQMQLVKVAAFGAMGLISLRPRENLPSELAMEIAEASKDVVPSNVVQLKTPRAPRKKHVCYWTDHDVWGAVIAVFLIGIFIGWCL